MCNKYMKANRFPGNLYYLTDELPAKYGYVKTIVATLNRKKKLSKSGRRYTESMVNNVVRGMHEDDNVKKELEAITKAYLAERERLAEPVAA